MSYSQSFDELSFAERYESECIRQGRINALHEDLSLAELPVTELSPLRADAFCAQQGA